MRTRHPILRLHGAAWGALLLVGSLAAQQEAPQQNAPAGQASQTSPVVAMPPKVKPVQGKIAVPAGTKLPLVLHNSISTRSAKPGDAVYFETLYPIVQEGRIVIPAGSYVNGEVIEAKRPGRVKGRGELRVRFNAMILPNGYFVNLNAIPTGAGTGAADTVEEEGKIKGASDKSGDVGTVVKTTGAGAAIGGIAARTGKGAGIGAAAGAAVGLATVLLTRGPELELPRGTTLDIMLDRTLYLDAEKIQFTDPGRASSLSGPENRQLPRNRIPY